MAERVHPDCINASNPSHECIDFCFLKIAESKEPMEQLESDVKQGRTTDGPASSDYPDQAEDHHVQESGREEHDNDNDNDDDDYPLEENVEVENTQLKEWKKKLFELNLKLDETRKAYDTAMVAELKRSEPSTESRGISKEKRIDERKKTIGKQLDVNGLDMKKTDMLETQEAAENKYKKCEKKPAPFGSDDVKQGRTTDGPASSDYPDQAEDHHVQQSGQEEHDNDNDNDNDDDDYPLEENVAVENTQLKEWKKKLFELNLKLDETRKAYDTAMVAELKRPEPSTESRGISKEKRIDERKKTVGKLLDANGLDMKKADMIDTQEAAENKYKKCEKTPAPFGSDVSNQKTVCDADKKLTKNIVCNVREYNKMKESFLISKMKEADPEFYGDASSSLQYGKAPKISEDKICKMVKELLDKDKEEDMIYKMVKELLDKDSNNAFSKIRKSHEEKDIDSIDDHNENFNKIIERAYGIHREIKNNLERETALQGCVGAGLFTFCIGVAVLNCIWVSIR